MSAELPEPLVPAEVDLRDFAYMELDVQRLRDSRFAAESDAEAFRAGVLLWCAAWHQVPAGSLPDSDTELSNLAGFGRVVREWKKVREQALVLFVKCSDGRLYHREVAKKANAAWRSRLEHFFDRANDRLRKANKARELKHLQPLPALTFEQWNSDRMAAGIPMEKAESFREIPPEEIRTSAGVPTENALKGEGTERRGNGEGTEKETFCVVGAAPPTAAKAAATPRGTRLPADWTLPKAWGEWALAEFPQWSETKVRTEGAKFADHWHAKPGKGGTALDWFAVWRNWCRSDIAHRDDPKPNGRGAPTAQPPLDELTAGVQRRLGIAPPSTEETIDG